MTYKYNKLAFSSLQTSFYSTFVKSKVKKRLVIGKGAKHPPFNIFESDANGSEGGGEGGALCFLNKKEGLYCP